MAAQASRKLAVILHADVVGSTKLVQRDESLAHERIQGSFRRFSETIEAYGGIAQEIRGDALVAEFARASDAVTAASAFQIGNTDPNTRLEGDIQPELRIGISLGEVIVADNTVTGEGVVLAQRLEQLAAPGEVVVQGSVSETVPRRMPFDFESLGERTLKGFDQPVRAFRVRLKPGEQIPQPEVSAVLAERGTTDAHEEPPLELPDKPSIVVLPFTNMSSDPEQEYFSDGVSEDIITDLSKVSGLFVIARNSAFTYKGKAANVPDVCRELGVRFALEGSIRKAGNRVRITAQLIDGSSGGHLWAERYDREMHDIFSVQDEVTQSIVEALRVRLSPQERGRVGGPSTTNVEAYDFALRGRELSLRFSADPNAEAQALLEKSIELDPTFSTAYSMLAVSLLVDYINSWNGATDETLERGLRLATTAVELDPDDSQGHWALALSHLWKRDLDGAIEEIEKAVALEPNNSHALANQGQIFSYAGRPTEAIKSLEKSMRLDPRYPNIYLHFLANAHFVQGNYLEAAVLLERRIRLHPETDTSRVLLASCHGHLGREEEARKTWAEAITINPNYSLERKGQILPYKNAADWDRVMEGLRKAGLPK